jgi:hypothetical protein
MIAVVQKAYFVSPLRSQTLSIGFSEFKASSIALIPNIVNFSIFKSTLNHTTFPAILSFFRLFKIKKGGKSPLFKNIIEVLFANT